MSKYDPQLYAQAQNQKHSTRHAIAQGLVSGLHNFLSGLEQRQSEQRKLEEQEAVDRELSDALAKMPEGLSPLQQAQYFANLRTPVREQAVGLMQHMPKQQSPREQIAPQQLFTNIVKKTLGNNPSEESVARAEQIMQYGGQFLSEGASPVEAYNKSRQLVAGREEAQNILQKQVVGPSIFSADKNLKNDISKIKKLKKTGIISDDEIAASIIQKGYGPGDLKQFGLDISPELAEELGIEAEPEAKPKGKKKKLSEADIDRFMAEADNDPDEAAKLAEQEGYDIEAA